MNSDCIEMDTISTDFNKSLKNADLIRLSGFKSYNHLIACAIDSSFNKALDEYEGKLFCRSLKTLVGKFIFSHRIIALVSNQAKFESISSICKS